MRKLLTLFVLIFVSLPLFAGTSNVTATITDSDSQTWNNGTFQVTFVPLPGTRASDYNVAGVSFTQSFSGSMNGSGVLTVTLTDLSTVSPTGGQWRFNLCPNASAGCSSVVTNAVVGGAPNLSSQLSTGLAGPRFASGFSSFGYADAEVSPTPQPGGTYFNVTNTALRVWGGASWSTVGAVSSTSVTAPLFISNGGTTAACNSFVNGIQMTASSNTGITTFGSNAVDICANATRVIQVSSGGTSLLTGVIGFSGGKGQHFTTQAANNDMAGTVSGATTTATVTFTTNYTSTPACVVTPTTAGVTSFIITAQSNSGFTITYAPSAATNFNYMCLGNSN